MHVAVGAGGWRAPLPFRLFGMASRLVVGSSSIGCSRPRVGGVPIAARGQRAYGRHRWTWDAAVTSRRHDAANRGRLRADKIVSPHASSVAPW